MDGQVTKTILALCLWHFLAIGSVVRCQESAEQWARTQLEWLAAQPLLESPIAPERRPASTRLSVLMPEFQFEYDMMRQYPGHKEPYTVRLLLERQFIGGGGDALLVLSSDGFPLLCGNEFDTAMIDPTTQKWVRIEPSVRFNVDLSTFDGVQTFCFLREEEHAPLSRIDFAQLLRQLRSDKPVVTGLPCARTVIQKKSNGSFDEIRITRERRPGQFPIVSLALHCQGGHMVLFSMFRKYPPIAIGGIPRNSIGAAIEAVLPRDPKLRCQLKEAASPQGTEKKTPFETVADDEHGKMLLPQLVLGKGKWWTDPVTSGKIAHAGKELLAKLTPWERLPPEEDIRLIATLDAMRLCDTTEHQNASSRTVALDELAAFVAARIVQPVRIEQGNPAGDAGSIQIDGVPVYLAGHERWRTAQRLEFLTGPERTSAVYDALRQVIVDDKALRDEHLQALDILGEIGVHPISRLLGDLDLALAHEKDVAIREMFASVKIRAGMPNESDIASAARMADNEQLPHWLRLVALESLMLADETRGRYSWIAETLRQATLGCRDYATRCLFAAGCCKEGRDALRHIVVTGLPTNLFSAAMFLVHTSIGPNDPQWDDCLKAAKAAALDESHPMDLRLKAAEIASFGEPDQIFQDAFVRAAFRSGDLKMFYHMRAMYLHSGCCHGERYLPELEVLMRSPIPRLREAAVACLDSSLSAKLSASDRKMLVELFRKMQSHKDADMRRMTLSVWKSYCKTDPTLIDELLLDYVEMARHDEDAFVIHDVAVALYSFLGRDHDMRSNFVYDENNEIRSEPERRRMAEKFRNIILTQIEQLVREWQQQHAIADTPGDKSPQ